MDSRVRREMALADVMIAMILSFFLLMISLSDMAFDR